MIASLFNFSMSSHNWPFKVKLQLDSLTKYQVPVNYNARLLLLAVKKTFRIIPEFRTLRLTFHRKSASKC